MARPRTDTSYNGRTLTLPHAFFGLVATAMHNQPVDSPYSIQYWMEPGAASQLDYFEYWNEAGNEEDKAWTVRDGDYSRMEGYLASSGQAADLDRVIAAVPHAVGRELGGKGIDLAAGNLWTVPRLLSLPRVTHVHALEYSEHRLVKLGLALLAHHNVAPSRVAPAYGSFYDVQLTSGSLDFVLLSAAFHHAEHPDRLLKEVRRILDPRGVLLMTGEHDVDSWARHLRHSLAAVVAAVVPPEIQRRLIGRVLTRRPLLLGNLPVDPILGDHEYTLREYRDLFGRNGFDIKHHFRGDISHCHGFILTRSQS